MSHYRPLWIATALSLLVAGLAVTGSPAAAETDRPGPVPAPSTARTQGDAVVSGVIDSSSWPLANYTGNGCIVARGANNEAPVVKTNCDLAYLDQYWSFVPVGSGYYQVRNANSGKCLLVRGNTYNTPAVQYTCLDFIDQFWYVIIDTTGRYFMLQNRNSGMCLVLRGSENNARQVTCDWRYVDQWWLRGMPSPPARTDGMTRPVYFVHGYTDDGTGFDANGSLWNDYIADYLFDRVPFGFSGPIARIWTFCYYSTDRNCDLLVPGDRNRPIRSVGADLAWDIYDRFSKFNVSVDIVAHSMGGLAARAAVTGVQRGDPAFPPFLLVEDAALISTPNRGAPSALLCQFTQCVDMRANSAFLSWLYDNPQAHGAGTDWTLIGAHDDGWAPVWSAVPDAMWSVGHKVIYDGDQIFGNAHMELLAATSGSYNYTYCDYFSTGCNMGSFGSFYHVYGGADPSLMTKYSIHYANAY